MQQHRWRLITALAAGILLALGTSVRPGSPVGAQDAAGTQESLVDLLVSDGLTRERMAGLYPALAAAPFQPPACVAGQEMFDDVPASSQFCRWIEELARRGITSGCTATQYCPGSPVTRAQMAVFVVRATETCPAPDPPGEIVRAVGLCWDATPRPAANHISAASDCGDEDALLPTFTQLFAAVDDLGNVGDFQNREWTDSLHFDGEIIRALVVGGTLSASAVPANETHPYRCVRPLGG